MLSPGNGTRPCIPPIWNNILLVVKCKWNHNKLLTCSGITLSNNKFEPISHPVVLHHNTKFNCCDQYFVFPPESHVCNSLPEKCVISLSINMSLNLIL